jgi:sRNA-binding protein
MSVTLGQISSNPLAWDNSCDDDDDGDSAQVVDCEYELRVDEKEINFIARLQAAEAAVEAAVQKAELAQQAKLEAARASENVQENRRASIGASPAGRNTRTNVSWLERDPNYLSATVRRTLITIVAGIPRSQLLTGAPVTVRLGQRSYAVSASAGADNAVRVSCQGYDIGQLACEPAAAATS